MSDSRSRIMDLRSRPSSEQLVDLHVYIVPPDIWRQKHHDVLNTDVNETISAGFIRVHPENKAFTIREDIEQQLGIEVTPKEYVFMKCVGRSLTRVKPKQEYQLKVKNFLPPQAYLPEVYLLEISPDDGNAYGLSSGEGSSRAQTRTSVHHSDSPRYPSNRNRYSEDDLDRYNSRERLNQENEKIRSDTYRAGPVLRDSRSALKSANVNSPRAQLMSRSSQRTGLTSKSTSLTSRDFTQNNTNNSVPRILLPPFESEQEGSASSGANSQGPDPQLLGSSLHPRYNQGGSVTPRGSTTPTVHSSLPSNTDNPNADSTSRSRSGQDGAVLPPITADPGQDQTTRKSHDPSVRQERSQDDAVTPRPDGGKPPLSATPPPSSDPGRRTYRKQPYQDDDRSARKGRSPDDAYGGQDYERDAGYDEDDAGRRDDRQRRREHDDSRRRREREAERQRQEEELRRWEDDRRQLQKQLEEEERDRQHFDEMEHQRQLAEEEMRQLMEEAKIKEDQDRKRLEQEDDLRRREEEEAFRRRDENQRKQEEQERLQAEQDKARQHAEQEELQRRQEAEDLRMIEEERLRLQNDDLMKQEDQPEEELAGISPSPTRLSSPDRELSEEEKKKKKAQKEKLQAELEKAREKRRAIERQREELVKKAKQLQTKTQNRRNHARDVWKKRYFEEKKKTFPLEDQCNRLRHEVDQIHRKLMTTLEGPRDAKGAKITTNNPSEKNNYKIQATRLQHEIEDLKRRVENSKMKLTAEMKLRNQAETELRALRAELTQKKINLTLTRSQQLASLSTNNDLAYMTPRTMITPRS